MAPEHSSRLSIRPSTELPEATSSMCCRSLAGLVGLQPSSQVMGRSRGPAQAGSTWWMRNHLPPTMVFVTCPTWAHTACQGVQPGAGLRSHPCGAAKAVDKAPALRAVVNLRCNGTLLRAGGGDPHPDQPNMVVFIRVSTARPAHPR